MARNFCNVNQMHLKSCVWLVHAISAYCFVIAYSGKWVFYVFIQNNTPHMLKHAFSHFNDVVLVNKAHLYVYLGEFRLSVSPQILVAKTPCELEITVKSRNHQQLLENLGALGKRIKFARVDS